MKGWVKGEEGEKRKRVLEREELYFQIWQKGEEDEEEEFEVDDDDDENDKGTEFSSSLNASVESGFVWTEYDVSNTEWGINCERQSNIGRIEHATIVKRRSSCFREEGGGGTITNECEDREEEEEEGEEEGEKEEEEEEEDKEVEEWEEEEAIEFICKCIWWDCWDVQLTGLSFTPMSSYTGTFILSVRNEEEEEEEAEREEEREEGKEWLLNSLAFA